MKKLLSIVIIASSVACNEHATRTENKVDSVADAISDSLVNKGDSLSAKVDSTYQAKADSVQTHKRKTK